MYDHANSGALGPSGEWPDIRAPLATTLPRVAHFHSATGTAHAITTADVRPKGCCCSGQQERPSHCHGVDCPLPLPRSWHLRRPEEHHFADALLFRNELTAVNDIHSDLKHLEYGAPPPTLRSQNTATPATLPASGNLSEHGPCACMRAERPMTLAEALVPRQRHESPSDRTD